MSSRGISPEQLRLTMAGFPTGVAVVTALGSDGPAGATVNAVTSLSLDPPLMLACLDRGSRTLRAVERSGRFGINGLSSRQTRLARGFASKGPVSEKWHGVEWEEHDGAPRIEKVALWLACDLESVIPGGDHVIVTGSVVSAERVTNDPLIYFAGEYGSL